MRSSMQFLCLLALVGTAESVQWSRKSSSGFMASWFAPSPIEDAIQRMQKADEPVKIPEETPAAAPSVAPPTNKQEDQANATRVIAGNATGSSDAGTLSVGTEPVRSVTTKNRGRKSRSREASLINSLQHLGDGTDAMGCVSHCRYGVVRHSWRECIERCVDNPFMRPSLMTMLPDEHHAPPSMEHSLPEGLELSEAVKKKYRLERSSEL